MMPSAPRRPPVGAARSEMELGPAGPWCQRWRMRQHSWRHRREGGFDRDRYFVAALDELSAKGFVTDHHYSGSFPASRLRFGLHDIAGDDALVGVAVLSVPVRAAVLTGVFPGLEPYEESLELGRFCLLDEVPANAETWMLARVFQQARERGLRGVVSFADPMPRSTSRGKVVMPGHVGTAYAAKGAEYLGRARARRLVLLPDASVLNERSAAKVCAQDIGHDHVEKRLVALGARLPVAGADRREWLSQALADCGARQVWHRGNHRFAFRLGGSRKDREAVVVGPARGMYPKEIDALAP